MSLLHRIGRRIGFELVPTKLNVGGGPGFRADGWINLDGTTGFELTPTCVFPVRDAALDLVYSSHTLEHLDDATVSRVLTESRRVLRPGGALLLKIPDFEVILSHYEARDMAYFQQPLWGFKEAIVPTLSSRGMPDTIATRAAYLFCGFWNSAFGNLFGCFNAGALGAYSGPPVMPQEWLGSTLSLRAPHAIAAVFSRYVCRYETDYTFNHQNAWSGLELDILLRSHGFDVSELGRDRLIKRYAAVPGISEMRGISLYREATI